MYSIDTLILVVLKAVGGTSCSPLPFLQIGSAQEHFKQEPRPSIWLKPMSPNQDAALGREIRSAGQF